MSLTNINPVKRLEYFLQDIADGKSTATKTPVRRIEEFLRRIAKKEAEQDAAISSSGVKLVFGGTYGSVYNSSGVHPVTSLPLSSIPAEIINTFRAAYSDLETGAEQSRYLIDHVKIYVNGARAIPNTTNYSETRTITWEVAVPSIGIIDDVDGAFVEYYTFTIRPLADSGDFITVSTNARKYGVTALSGTVINSNRYFVTYEIYL